MNQRKLDKFLQKHLMSILIVSVILMLMLPRLLTWTLPWNFFRMGSAGDVGDAIGGITAPVLGIVTIILVYMAYRTQRKELKAAKKELKQARKIANAQAKTQVLQQFESTFFQMIEINRQLMNEVSIPIIWTNAVLPDNCDQTLTGSKALAQISRDVESVYQQVLTTDAVLKINFSKRAEWIRGLKNKSVFLDSYNHVKNLPIKTEQNQRQLLIELWEYVFSRLAHELGHYFRNTYHIVKFVDQYKDFETLYAGKGKQELDSLTQWKIIGQKRKYLNILRSTWSSYQINLIWFNSLSKYGEKFRPYVHNYLLLDNIDFDAGMPCRQFLIDAHPYLRISHRVQFAEELPYFNFDVFKEYHHKNLWRGKLVTREGVNSTYLWYLPLVYDNEEIISAKDSEALRKICYPLSRPD